MNNTDQNLAFYTPDKKRLPGQSPFGSPITLLPGKATKVVCTIQDSGQPYSAPSSKQLSQAFSVNVVGISNRITVMKEKDKHYDMVLHTTWSRVSPTDSILSKITTIDPEYVVCN